MLSEPIFQVETGHITLLMITSAKHSSWNSDYKITDLKKAGLDAPSIIRQKIFTIDIQLILATKGELNSQDKIAIGAILKKHINI